MVGDELPEGNLARFMLVTAALRLVWISVVFGVLSGAVSVTTGLRDHSLGVFAIGLGVLADVTGSAVLIWRFRAERRQPVRSGSHEARAAIIVAIALAVVSAVLIIESAVALAALVLYDTLGWWWADRIAALIVAAAAGAEAWQTAPSGNQLPEVLATTTGCTMTVRDCW